jgi:subtilisin family serine protease
LVDNYGHGTHVAGIIAGEVDSTDSSRADSQATRKGGSPPMKMVIRQLDANQEVITRAIDVTRISGVAPECKLLSLKVLDDEGRGNVSTIIEALGYVQTINEHGRWLHIQGVNLSVGYDYKAEWFACGQSPLCVEVDRLVRSGVVVVVAAGNTGYGFVQSEDKGVVPAGLGLTINDPGNADLAITVGATHREKPHIYGVSYFSSKGPTGDGRYKPDLVAPGEKIISCAAGKSKEKVADKVAEDDFQYVESSGTSMAAPHVSGAIAAFLSIRREFEGQPERIKQIFLDTATDLGRERYFQGHGLVDLMRAIQSV